MEDETKEGLPTLMPGAPGRPRENRYRQQYGVIVLCDDEMEQERLFTALRDLSARPLRLRVVVT